MSSVCLVRKRCWAVRLTAHAPCEGLCRLTLPLLWDSLSSLSMSTVLCVTLSLMFFHCSQPLEIWLSNCMLCMRCDTFPEVCHSCASCCAVTPPAGQTQAPTYQTNPNNYQILQSKFPGRKRKFNVGQLTPKCLTQWRSKGGQEEINSDVPTTMQCYETEIRHIYARLVN